ncbi:hypothetical protein ER308_12550 [Egibacter rhizosphaerae]|uniref:Uncharacterized protein n=1 Tax=Egibacter rhizosphaerae TaxID=1670831 RepID=A0A411YGV8_9ACTN|nr:hypothetical protein ER308_12550 [Egibacter rhizosphaerae]
MGWVGRSWPTAGTAPPEVAGDIESVGEVVPAPVPEGQAAAEPAPPNAASAMGPDGTDCAGLAPCP